MARFAEGTTVEVAKSQAEIAATVTRYGATGFMYGQDEDAGVAVVRFRAHGRIVRFEVPLVVDRAQFARTESGRTRDPASVSVKVDAEIKRRWRALLLAIKAKLEVVSTGISTFEEEFLAHIELPDGRTMGQWSRPAIAQAYETNAPMPMLPGSSGQIKELT